jgi:diguanylate cyclase (GGDEF)-like protein
MERDPLTGLPTKHKFLEEVAAWRTGAVLYVDIDQLRFSNAVFGHVKTDALLKSMSNLVVVVCDGNLVGRVSGAQFAVFVRDADQALGLAEQVRNAFHRSYEAERAHIRAGASAAGVIDPVGPLLTVSIGVSRVEAQAVPLDALQMAQRLALKAVIAGRDRVAA